MSDVYTLKFKTCGDITEIIKERFNDNDNLSTTTIGMAKPKVKLIGTITMSVDEYTEIKATPYDLNDSIAIKAREKYKGHKRPYKYHK